MKSAFCIILILTVVSGWAVIHKIGDLQYGMGANSITISGNYAYIASGSYGLNIVDVSDPQNIELEGNYNTPGTALFVTVVDNLAFVADGDSGLQIIDITDPSLPARRGFIDTSGIAYSVSVYNNIAYVADGEAGLTLINVSSSSSPQLIGTFNTPGIALSVIAQDNLAYVADGDSGLQIIDVSNTNSLRRMSYYHETGYFQSVALVGNYIYVSNENTRNCIVDVSNPHIPQYAGSISSEARFISTNGNYAYVVGRRNDLQIYDISNAASPQLLGVYDTYNVPVTVAGYDNYVFIFDTALLNAIDISNIENTYLAGSYHPTYSAQSIQVQGNYLYLKEGTGVLDILNITNPESPQFVSNCNPPGYISEFQVVGTKVYMTTGDSLFQIMDITNPSAPALQGSCALQDAAKSICVVGDYAYVADGMYGLKMINISNAMNPSIEWSYATTGKALSVLVDDNLAFIGVEFSGLLILNLLNLQNPFVSLLSGASQGLSIAKKDYIVYMSDINYGVKVIDISLPDLPVLITSLEPHSSSSLDNCYIKNDYLILADNKWNEIAVYNIASPQNPILEDTYSWNLRTLDVCLNNGYLYTANGFNNMNVINLATLPSSDETTTPVQQIVVKNYPNPFKSNTTISYSLLSAGITEVAIYNIRGQLVRKLISNHQKAGNHTTVWNGDDENMRAVASGMYFCRLESSGKRISKKIILMK